MSTEHENEPQPRTWNDLDAEAERLRSEVAALRERLEAARKVIEAADRMEGVHEDGPWHDGSALDHEVARLESRRAYREALAEFEKGGGA